MDKGTTPDYFLFRKRLSEGGMGQYTVGQVVDRGTVSATCTAMPFGTRWQEDCSTKGRVGKGVRKRQAWQDAGSWELGQRMGHRDRVVVRGA